MAKALEPSFYLGQTLFHSDGCEICTVTLGVMLSDELRRLRFADLTVGENTNGQFSALMERLAADERTSSACEAALRLLGLALEVRDGETKGHTDRVAALAMRMAEALCWSPSQTRALRWGAYLHDIGKIAIPDAVLLKPGALNAGEWAVMRSHVGEGVHFVAALGFLPATALEVVRDHHERWNGQGYPVGKAGCEISLAGRLFALCDVYDALTSGRPYKAAWTAEAALAEIEGQAGQHFDPVLTGVFLELLGSEGARMDRSLLP